MNILSTADFKLLDLDKAYFFLIVNRRKQKIYLKDISYIESSREYVRIHMRTNSFLVKGSITSFSEMLSGSYFVRIHRRYLVSIDKIIIFDSRNIYGSDFKLPLGRTYKSSLSGKCGFNF